MSDVPLEGTHQQRIVFVTTVTQGTGDRAELDGVAHPGSGAVSLQVLDLVRLDPSVLEGTAQHDRLSLLARLHVGAGGSAVVDRAAAHHRVDLITIREGLFQQLENHHGHSIGPSSAIRILAKGLGLPVGCQHAGRRVAHRVHRIHQQIGAAGDRQRTIGRLQGAAGQVQRHQGRRTGRIHHDAGTAKVEGGADSTGQPTAHGASYPRVDVIAVGIEKEGALVLGIQAADVHPRL